jgi:hypothetical protein
MLQDDYEKLMNYFQQSMEGKPVNLEDVCAQSLAFFQDIRGQLESGNEQEKQETLLMMAEMYKKLMGECKKLTERTGMTEEQIIALADNPQNYTQEQWRLIQETKQNVTSMGAELAKLVSSKKVDGPAAGGATPSEKQPKTPKSKKSKWMRS